MTDLSRAEIEAILSSWAKDFTDPQCPQYVCDIQRAGFKTITQLLRQLDAANARRIARVPRLEATVTAQAAEIARLRDALEFYANTANWCDTPSWDGDPSCFTPKAIPVQVWDNNACDCGNVARAAVDAANARADALDAALTRACVSSVDSDATLMVENRELSLRANVAAEQMRERCIRVAETTARDVHTTPRVVAAIRALPLHEEN